MGENKKIFDTIDDYISQYTPEIQEKLITLRKVIKDAAPEAEEKMSWQMPTFAFYGNLVHFAVCKNHIGLYPAPSGIEAFRSELSEYKKTKGSIHFPIKEPMPYELISKIVKYRVLENIKFAEEKIKEVKLKKKI